MKNYLKNLLLAAAALGISAMMAFNCQAQQYGATTILSGKTIAASATTNCTTLTLTKAPDVALEVAIQSADNGSTSNATISVYKSLDGTTFETTAGISWTMALTGNTVKRYITNFTVGPIGYLRVTVANGDSGQSMTNVTVKAYQKPTRLGN